MFWPILEEGVTTKLKIVPVISNPELSKVRDYSAWTDSNQQGLSMIFVRTKIFGIRFIQEFWYSMLHSYEYRTKNH